MTAFQFAPAQLNFFMYPLNVASNIPLQISLNFPYLKYDALLPKIHVTIYICTKL